MRNHIATQPKSLSWRGRNDTKHKKGRAGNECENMFIISTRKKEQIRTK